MIHAQIFRDHHNHIPHVTSNYGGRLPDLEATTLEKNVFHIPPLLYSYYIRSSYTICFKIIYLDPFRLYYTKSSERSQ